MPDYYQILAVAEDATPELIQINYHFFTEFAGPQELSQAVAFGSPLAIGSIKEAGAVLLDAQRRAAYDQHRDATSPRPKLPLALLEDLATRWRGTNELAALEKSVAAQMEACRKANGMFVVACGYKHPVVFDHGLKFFNTIVETFVAMNFAVAMSLRNNDLPAMYTPAYLMLIVQLPLYQAIESFRAHAYERTREADEVIDASEAEIYTAYAALTKALTKFLRPRKKLFNLPFLA